MASRRRALLLVTLSMVMGVHLIIIWLLMSPPRLVVKSKSGSLQLVWLALPAFIDSAPERQAMTPRPKAGPARNHADRTPVPSSLATQSNEADNTIHPIPDWNQELQLAAKNAVTSQLAQKRHDLDFGHAFPAAPQKPAQFAWDYAATHRVEAIPGGGILVHLSDNCVLIIFPLPFVGCGIGKRPENGELFEHLHDR
jgi:hypothetical protein